MATVIELIEAGARQLEQAGVAFGHGTTNAFDEAAWLVLWRLGLPLHDLDSVANSAVTPADQAQIATLLIARVDSRRPAAYLTREAWLQGVPFYVDERTIVPRSLIAELIAYGALDGWLPESDARVLDLCTGNGSLAVLAAMAWPDAQVTAADISRPALEVAAINARRHAMEARIDLVESDALTALAGPFDLVLCNPPYVNDSSMALLPAEFRAEPVIALAGGVDGMDFVRRLVAELPERLGDAGVLVLEIGHERAHFETAFPRLEALWLETSAGDDQVLLLTREALLAARRPSATHSAGQR